MTNKDIKFLLTGTVVLVAVGVVNSKYWYYITNPWTRDGQVRAQVTPRVSGPIVDLPIKDNQLVKAGDLLFKIDPRTFRAAVDKAQADLQQAQVDAKDAKEEADRARRIWESDKGAMSAQQLERKENDQRRAEAAVLGAQAALQQARLDLEFTEQ